MEDSSHADSRRYPIGRFVYSEQPTAEQVKAMVDVIESFPQQLAKLLSQYNEEQMDQSYRPGGWSIRQVVHHLADSHMNAYVRFKIALTEQMPTIKPYNENAWAELLDSKTLPVDVSLNLLTALHRRWVVLLRAMDDQAYRRTFFHPQHMKLHTLYELLAMYAWHCQHHYAHIQLITPTPAEAAPPQAAKKKTAATRKSRAGNTAKKSSKK